MCRNIRTLFNFEPPATDDEVRAASLQFVRKLSGFTVPSKGNQAAFDEAVGEVAVVARRLLAALAVHDRTSPDGRFVAALPLLVTAARDERPYVRKAVNWALRQIGKRDAPLHAAALTCARDILALGTPAARWIARDALRELTAPATLRRIAARRPRA